MRRYTILSEIRDDIKTIEKLVLDADDGFAEGQWCELKDHIREVAETCKATMAEREERDRQEAAERRASKRAQAKKVSS